MDGLVFWVVVCVWNSIYVFETQPAAYRPFMAQHFPISVIVVIHLFIYFFLIVEGNFDSLVCLILFVCLFVFVFITFGR